MVASFQNFGQYGVQIILNFEIAKSQDLKPFFFKYGFSLQIRGSLAFMNFSIYFDDKGRGVAIEVNDVTKKDLLAPEVPAAKFVGAHALP